MIAIKPKDVPDISHAFKKAEAPTEEHPQHQGHDKVVNDTLTEDNIMDDGENRNGHREKRMSGQR